MQIWTLKNQQSYKPILSTPELKMNDSRDLQQWYSSEDEELSTPSLQKRSISLISNETGCLPITKYMYNIKYNLVHSDLMPISSLQRRAIILSQDSEPCYLLGNVYYHSTMEELVKHYREIIWISYRTNNKIGKSDAGWGCMIRVIQMVLAEVLKRNNPDVELSEIIELFKQGQQHKFSLDNICSLGNIKQRWTGSTEVLSIVSSMIRIESKKPAKSQINFNVELQIYYGILHLKNTVESEKGLQFPRMVIISSKIEYGCNQTIPAKYLDHLKHLMKIETFCGMVGGVSNQALYIVGFHEDKAIVLDPHYIQDETEENSETKYFRKTPRGIPLTKLRPSISFCFYFTTINEYRAWASEICYSYRIYSPFTIFEIDAQDSESVEKYRKRSEDFQVL